MYISEYVEIDESTSMVHFFNDEWINVDDLDVWVANFFEEGEKVASTIGGDSHFIERIAFDNSVLLCSLAFLGCRWIKTR